MLRHIHYRRWQYTTAVVTDHRQWRGCHGHCHSPNKLTTKTTNLSLSLYRYRYIYIYIYIYIDIYIYIYIYTHTHTHTGHFIRYTLLVPGWTNFCLQNCLNSSWHRFNKVLEAFLRDFGPYWHDSITQLLQICRLHIHDANLPFHHIPNVLYWIEI